MTCLYVFWAKSKCNDLSAPQQTAFFFSEGFCASPQGPPLAFPKGLGEKICGDLLFQNTGLRRAAVPLGQRMVLQCALEPFC